MGETMNFLSHCLVSFLIVFGVCDAVVYKPGEAGQTPEVNKGRLICFRTHRPVQLDHDPSQQIRIDLNGDFGDGLSA